VSRDLRSRTRPEHIALLNRAADDGDSIAAQCDLADTLVELGWLELRCKLEQVQNGEVIPAKVATYRITPHGLRVHAKAHGRSLTAPTPALELLSDSDRDEPEPFGCSPPTITRASQRDTWGLGR
jgi:hypothetical protein